MDEREWLVSKDVAAMLRYITGRATDLPDAVHMARRGESRPVLVSDRQLRLFACACCYQVWPLLTDKRSRRAVEVASRYADGEAMWDELSAAHDAAHDGVRWARYAAGRQWPEILGQIVCGTDASAVATAMTLPGQDIAPATQAALLRDIIGNPHKVQDAIQFEWGQYRLAKQIARRIYDERDFDALPILADALEEAGCTNADVLSHCRSEGIHVRGCWLVDILLGKA